MGGNRFPALLRGGRQAAIGFGIALIAFGNGATHEAHQGLLVADQGHTAGILAPVRSPIAGTVVAVRAADHQYVTAGSVLISLSASRYRSAIARAVGGREIPHFIENTICAGCQGRTRRLERDPAGRHAEGRGVRHPRRS